jgi:hypothetical protein
MPVVRRLKFLILFAWTCALLAVAWVHYPVPIQGCTQVAGALGVTVALLAGMLGIGRAILRRFRLYHGSLVEELVFSLALGLAVFSLLGSALGALGALYGWVVWGLVAFAGIISWGHWEALYGALRRSLRSKHPWEGSSNEVATVLCLFLALLAVVCLAAAPPKFFDALVYHLADAQRAAQTGRMEPQAGVLFSWLPSLTGPLWAMALVMDGSPAVSALAPALLNLAVCAALGLMLMDASARLLSERRIWLAPALALTQPLLLLSFGVFSPDAWTAFYAFLSLDAFLLALADPVQRSQSRWLLLSAALAGAAVAVKPVALIHALVLLLMLAAMAFKERSWRRPGLLLAGAGLFLVPLLPWLLQGAIRLGQPFYPFPVHILGLSLGQGGPAPYFEHLAGYGGGGWESWIRLPWAAFFDTKSLGGDGNPGFLLLALAPAALVWRLDRSLRWCLLYLVLCGLLWCLGPHVLRYAMFMLPAASLMAAHGVLEAETWAFSRTWTYLWRGIVLVGLLSGALQCLEIVVMDFDPLAVSLGLEAPEDYLARMGVPQARAAAWIRQRGGADAGVLVLGDERTAYLPPRSLAASVYESHPLAQWVAQARSPQEVGAIARSKGYDFVFFNGAEWDRLQQGPLPPRYWPDGDPLAQARFKAWLDSLYALPPQDRLVAGKLLVAHLH